MNENSNSGDLPVKNRFFAGVLVGALVIGGAWLLVSLFSSVSDEADGMEGSVTTVSTSTKGTEQSSKSSGTYRGDVGDLLARGGSYTCTVSRVTGTGKTDASVYISGNRLHGVFMTTYSSGAKLESHLLYLSRMAYGWMSGVQQGYKAPATAATLGTALRLSGSLGFDYGQTLDYKCRASGVDAATFEFPKGYTFTTI